MNYFLQKSIIHYAKQDTDKSKWSFKNAEKDLLSLEEKLEKFKDYNFVEEK